MKDIEFPRQLPPKNHIVDFYCNVLRPEACIKIDGLYHHIEGQKVYNDIRTRQLEILGCKVLRFTNDEVLLNIESVLAKINFLNPLLRKRIRELK